MAPEVSSQIMSNYHHLPEEVYKFDKQGELEATSFETINEKNRVLSFSSYISGVL